jgi:hypothetical protein
MPTGVMVLTQLTDEMALKRAINRLKCALLSFGIVTDTTIHQTLALATIRCVGVNRGGTGLHQIRCREQGQVSAVAVRHCCPI